MAAKYRGYAIYHAHRQPVATLSPFGAHTGPTARFMMPITGEGDALSSPTTKSYDKCSSRIGANPDQGSNENIVSKKKKKKTSPMVFTPRPRLKAPKTVTGRRAGPSPELLLSLQLRISLCSGTQAPISPVLNARRSPRFSLSPNFIPDPLCRPLYAPHQGPN